MRPAFSIPFYLLMAACAWPCFASAQEHEGPVMWNPALCNPHPAQQKGAKKTTAALSLPFFEDFNYYTPWPDSNKWADFEVYINNTMCVSPISWGVASFDDLNSHGLPYDSFSNSAVHYADSLTSQPINISTNSPADSLYLSFFYQARGNGYNPPVQDSLMLFFKNKFGDYIKVWSAPGPPLGTPVLPFQQVLIPLTDTLDFHGNFQFRFVNIASLNWADANWNLDYIKLDKNRSFMDTVIGDAGFTTNPTYLLNDYTSMPYAQFKASPTSEIVSQISDSVRNDTLAGQTVNYSFTIKDGAFPLAGSPVYSNIFLAANQTGQATELLTSIAGFPNHPANTPVSYEIRFFMQSTATTGPTSNDTIIRQQQFDNYLAYDDGTAEKAYYLNLFPSLPGRIAIEYHLNKPDTLRGMAIYFARQIPFANYKPFEVNIYSSLAGINGYPTDNVIYSSDQLSPAYADSVNHFWIYNFDTAILLPAGTFYAGTTQSAEDGSDSIYYGLDVNRIGGNHAYYNVLGSWSPSLISGAIMMRPIIGKAVSGSFVNELQLPAGNWTVSPNPAHDKVSIRFSGDQSAGYTIAGADGRQLLQGTVFAGRSVDIASLLPGVYFISLKAPGISPVPVKIIKL